MNTPDFSTATFLRPPTAGVCAVHATRGHGGAAVAVCASVDGRRVAHVQWIPEPARDLQAARTYGGMWVQAKLWVSIDDIFVMLHGLCM